MRWRARFTYNSKQHWLTVDGKDRYEATTAARLVAPPFWHFQEVKEIKPSLHISHWNRRAKKIH